MSPQDRHSDPKGRQSDSDQGEQHPLIDVASSISDGARVDWQDAEDTASTAEIKLDTVHQLKALHDIADVHRKRHAAASPPTDATMELLVQAQDGDDAALNRLCERYLPRLRRWATGRLPRAARDLWDTEDLVQETVIRMLKRLDQFEPRHDGALQAYLRQAILNRIRDEARRVRTKPAISPMDFELPDRGPSPVDAAVGREVTDRYDDALMRLREEDRIAIILRCELDHSYQEIATVFGKPSPDAARMMVSRALVRLAEEMGHPQR